MKLWKVRKKKAPQPQQKQSNRVNLKAAQENWARFCCHVPLKKKGKIKNPANAKIDEALKGLQFGRATSMVFAH